MELKSYQSDVINDLKLYLKFWQSSSKAQSYSEIWKQKGYSIDPGNGLGLPPYQPNGFKVPNVCIKVPTAGGKTFIACNALSEIFAYKPSDRAKVVLWFVPSTSILEQTLKNLKNPSHPYRLLLNSHFQNRVEIFSKEDVILGNNFNAVSILENLNILVFSYQTFRIKNKEDRKSYQENSNLISFIDTYQEKETLLMDVDESALVNVLNQQNPVIIVDESHNAGTELSLEMLKNLNPFFILELTATPKTTSNLISIASPVALKKESMVKLPVIVYNQKEVREVIESAIKMRDTIEKYAIEEEKKNVGSYIRPIVLFQISETGDIQFFKQKLVSARIPVDEIAIKTAKINDLKGIDLLDKNCKIRYIITINALKEGWDCPFAYILANLADRSSSIDVEQILGRILRQPYTKPHEYDLLNISYVFTASEKFYSTLDKIILGLNMAGYGLNDFKAIDNTIPIERPKMEEQILIQPPTNVKSEKYIEPTYNELMDLDAETINPDRQISTVNVLIQEAEKQMKQVSTPESIQLGFNKFMNIQHIKDEFKSVALSMKIPQFFMKISSETSFFSETETLLQEEYLYDGMELLTQDTIIDFDSVDEDVYKIDVIEYEKGKFTLEKNPLEQKQIEHFKKIVQTLPVAQQRSRIKYLILDQFKGKNFDHVDHEDITEYINRILTNFDSTRIHDLIQNPKKYQDKFRTKVDSLYRNYAKNHFIEMYRARSIFTKEHFQLKPYIESSNAISDAISKSLYPKESDMNNDEKEIIQKVSQIDKVLFWHRNISRKGFCLNGYVKHYPDFIIQLKNNHTILLETKGEHLAGSVDTENKLELSGLWKESVGTQFDYFMVFKNEPKVSNSRCMRLDAFVNMLKNYR